MSRCLIPFPSLEFIGGADQPSADQFHNFPPLTLEFLEGLRPIRFNVNRTPPVQKMVPAQWSPVSPPRLSQIWNVLNLLIRTLVYFPGRKNLLFFSRDSSLPARFFDTSLFFFGDVVSLNCKILNERRVFPNFLVTFLLVRFFVLPIFKCQQSSVLLRPIFWVFSRRADVFFPRAPLPFCCCQ